jgi:aspartate oxidase
LRDSEESHYTKSGKSFTEDEKYYRLGFEAALHAKRRCVEFDQVSGEMNAALEDVQRQHPGVQLEEAFTQGYQRGRDYYQQRCDETGKAA